MQEPPRTERYARSKWTGLAILSSFASHSATWTTDLLSISSKIIFDFKQFYFHFQAITACDQELFTYKRLMPIRIAHGSAL
ncbi:MULTISPECIES: hypothetical protein [Mycobacterium]|uniref:Mycobacterium terramassiliense ORFan n=1 Tax=Mycobacterium terramassiliense TaxID=1841859 RepID=A0A2U3NFY3_9MYCO|nr:MULTISPECIES: hypothetical protein [Mycobacterium]MCV7090982.1 hypothetical protein [Mycobacterium interjectum]ORV86920.1 hypothetical protein AWC11_15915 [Mycobacterium interjectum]SPM30400.1 Mycobacterium terramassiliense ORFan [Mycobacterium terramassiliense]